jgi:hypothetical protein
MGVYLSFVVARSVPDLERDNCFVSNAPTHIGLHSSYVDILFGGVAKHTPELKSPPWFKHAFSVGMQRLAPNHFFEPRVILADLERIRGIVATYPQDFPTMHWLRVGNLAGIHCVDLLPSIDVYHEGRPSTIFGGWDKVELRPGYPRDSSQPPIDFTSAASFACRLCSTNPAELDGLEVQVSIDRQPFARVIARELEAACSVCRWANTNSCLVIPWLG